ncbi:MAG: amidohydrolase family protein [Vicinamibacterales bacterium]|jgi:imidazolonepropionase-like amidohydrolase|nr:amidohydrolase family protein [Vicinamibacterales bacterium]
MRCNRCSSRCSLGRIVASVLVSLTWASLSAAQPGGAPGAEANQTVVLRTARVLDGTGDVLENRDIVVRAGSIAELLPAGRGRGDVVYDLTEVTVLPGYIDTHVHISRHFDAGGRLHPPEEVDDIGHLTLYGAENAYRTLMSGVTTVQSLGAAEDAELKAWIERGTIPGPRVLSSLGAVRSDTGTPAEIRAFVRDRAEAGADVVKIFAATSIRFGGVTNLSAAQLEAACGEARAQGLRSVVHLHRPDAVRLAADAGCTQIEHAWLVDRAALETIAESGMYLGNQIDLLFRNYAEHESGYVGIGGYSAEGFVNLQAARPGARRVFEESLEVPGLKVVYSTDAVAGGHGRNAQELVAYVEIGGLRPMDVIISSTSLAAESLGLGDQIGTIAAGMAADVIALDGDPLIDAAALGRVVFVMRGGEVHKNSPPMVP